MDSHVEYPQLMEAIGRWTDSLNRKDFDVFYEIEKESFGYGWRGSGFRDQPIDREMKIRNISNWRSSIKGYTCVFEPEKVRIVGDTALVCGVFHEEITEKDGSKGNNNVRTSMAWLKTDGQWRLALYHRDTQFT
jgi:ketosteroid isomerase-like protein